MTDEQQLPLSDEVKKQSTSPAQVSRGPLFGSILFGIIILLLLGVLVMIAWGGYHGYRLNQEQAALPSIATLSAGEVVPEVADEPIETTTQQEKPSVDAMDEASLGKAKATMIKVLNGGAAKGSASVLAEALKKQGYTQVIIGNTIKDYSGVVVYFAPEVEKEAAIVKNDLLKTYPGVEIKSAITTNTETTQAPLSIIVGK
jgi:hypothetical protein